MGSTSTDSKDMPNSPPRSTTASKVDSILFNGDNGPASQLLNNMDDLLNNTHDTKDMSSSSSGDDDPSEGEEQSNLSLVDNILQSGGSSEATTPPRSNTDPQQEHHKVQFAGVDSPTLPKFNVQEATRTELYQRLDFLQQRLTQAQIDLSGEKGMRKRKEKNLMKLAKELSRRQKQSEKHEGQLGKLAETIQQLEQKLLTAEKQRADGGAAAVKATNGAANGHNNKSNDTSAAAAAAAVADTEARMARMKQEAAQVNDRLRQDVLRAKSEADQLRTTMTHANREVDRLHSVVANANREVNRLRTAMSALEMKNQELEKQLVVEDEEEEEEEEPVLEQQPRTVDTSSPPSPMSLPPSPLAFLFRKTKSVEAPSVITTSSSSRSLIKTSSASSDVRFSALVVSIATVLAIVSLIISNLGMFHSNALCAPAMPGTLLPPMKNPFQDGKDGEENTSEDASLSSFAAPWWAPASYKEAAFAKYCQALGHAPVELTWHESGILSAINMSSGKSLMRKSHLAGAQIEAKRIILTSSQTGVTEEITAPWAI